MEIKETYARLFEISSSHKGYKKFSKIGEGKTYGYEADMILSWVEALLEWDKNGRIQ